MNLRSVAPAPAVAFLVLACSPQGNDTGLAGSWVGTIAIEGDVTTVVNESGSVWGSNAALAAQARLVPEGIGEIDPAVLERLRSLGYIR
jgi:hypothetical protein